MLFLLLLLSSL